MIVAAILLAILVGAGLLLFIHDRLTAGKESRQPVVEESAPAEEEPSEVCCGMHEVCEKKAVAAIDTIIYYDDEELDAYAGRLPDSYSDDEVEQFRDVLLTLLPHDVAPWARSLELRNIALPAAVAPELTLRLSEMA